MSTEADLALVEERWETAVREWHLDTSYDQSRDLVDIGYELLALAREALKGREDTARLDELERHFANGLTSVIRGGHDRGQVLAVFHRLEQCTLRGIADATRCAAGGK